MSDRSAVEIIESEWTPRFVKIDSNGSRKHLSLREHKDGKRAIVSAIQRYDGERFSKYTAGVLCGVDGINDAILDVADEMAEKTNDDTWFDLKDQLNARRKAIRI